MKPVEPLGCGSLQSNEKKLAEALLALHNDDSYVHYLGRIDKKKYKVEKRILIVTSHKIFCMKPSGKLARESHLLDLLEIRSSEPSELELIFRVYQTFTLHTYAIINAIRRAFEANFAEAPSELRPKLFIKQSSKLSEGQLQEPAVSRDNRPCRGFISTYRSFDIIKVYRGVPARLDVCWDLAHIHARKGKTKLNLTHFQQPLSPEDVRVLLETLRFNSFFTILSLKDMKFEKEKDLMVASVSETLRFNTSLTQLNIRGIGATREGIVQLSESLALNKHISLIRTDLSNNPLEDRGMVSFAGYLQHTTHNVKHLNFSGCNIGSKGIVALAVGFSTNPNISSSLRYLSLSNNKLGQEACKSLSDWLSVPPIHLTHLLLSSTTSSDSLEILITAITKGCGQLTMLDISNNVMEKESSKALIGLIKNGAPHLSHLDLTNTQLPIDSLKEILKIAKGELILKENNLSSFPEMINSVGSKITNITKLDLSDNDLGDEGVQLVAQGLCNSSSVSHLILNGNFKPAKTRPARVASIDALIALLRSPCPLKKLELAAVGNPATGRSRAQTQLRQDLLPLLAVISLNTTLTSLDISGHQMGNKGATALGKALQINNTLLHIAWDENGTTLPGFSYFRIGISANRSVVQMPLPLVDINQAMKGAWETGSSNDKLLQIIRDIESCIFRNATFRLPSPPAPTIPTPTTPTSPTALSSSANHHGVLTTPPTTVRPPSFYHDPDDTDGSSPLGSVGGLDNDDEEEDDSSWAWAISGDGVNASYTPSLGIAESTNST